MAANLQSGGAGFGCGTIAGNKWQWMANNGSVWLVEQ